MGRNVTEVKLESEKGPAKGRIKDFLGENSDEDFERSEVGSELVGTGCSSQDEAMRKFQNVVDLLQLSKEQAEQLSLSMLGEENREEKVGIKYRYDQRTAQEIIVIPSEWLEANVASTDLKKESFGSFDEEARRGNEVEECKYFDEEKEFGDRELESQNTKKIEEKRRRETLMLVDIESKEPKRLQEENRGKFLPKLEKVVTPEGFVYYVDNSSANNGGDDCFPNSDSDNGGSKDEEVEFRSEQNELAVCTQEKNSDCLDLLSSPEFLSLVGGGQVDMREIESNQRTFAESLAEDYLRATWNEEIDAVIEEVPCLVERRGCVSSRDEVKSFRNKNKIREKSNGSVCPATVSSGHWRCTDLQTNRIAEIFRQVEWSGNPADLKGKWLKLWAVNNPQGDAAVKEFQAELETISRAVVDFEKDRSVV